MDSAREAQSVSTLSTALAAEQTSYQMLLKLRAREHEVSKSKNGGGSKGGGSSRSQTQLQQLELTNKKQRYETENQASQPAAAQPDRESLQILNRLRELAERQKDLNEQLKELANKQRFAKTDAEREEIERQLKRLRERQRELLRQADEVAQRMDQAKQPDSMKSRRELEQTRQHLQQSAQSLKEGQVSRALNSGTRAQQKLNQLKNDFRKKTANQLLLDLDAQTKTKEELILDFFFVQRSDAFIPSKATITDLTSSGKLSLIRDKTLRTQLLSFYESFVGGIRKFIIISLCTALKLFK